MSREAGNKINLQSGQTRDNLLLIEWFQHSLSYTVFSSKTNTVLLSGVSDTYFDLFDNTEQEFSRLISNEPIFGYSFGQYVHLVNSLYYTLVPSPYFDAEKPEQILNFNIKLPSGNFVYESVFISKFNAYLVYAYPKNLQKALEKSFVNSKIDFFATKYIPSIGEGLHCHASQDNVLLSFVYEEKLLFFNSFSFNSAEDFVYSVLNVYQQLGLSAHKQTLHLSGSIPIDSACYELLYKYVQNIQFQPLPVRINYSDDVKAMPEHYFFNHYANLI